MKEVSYTCSYKHDKAPCWIKKGSCQKYDIIPVNFKNAHHFLFVITRDVNIWVKTTMTTATNLFPSQTRVKRVFTRYINPQWQGKLKDNNTVLEAGK